MEENETWRILRYEEVGSTNDIAKMLSAEPPARRFVVTARRQTSGRARRGRSWQSLDGNLFMSQAFPLELRYLNDAVFLVSLSLYEAVTAFAPRGEVRLKWPNDVLIENRKISGILLEKGENEYIIAGIGVNIASAPPAREPLLYPAAALADFGVRTDCPKFLEAYLHAFDGNFDLWRQQGFMPIREKWLSHAKGLREEIVVNLEKRRETGIFEGLSENGALLLRQRDEIVPILAGDIFYKKEN